MNAPGKKIGIVGFGEMGKRHGCDFIELSKGTVFIAAVVEVNDTKYEEGCQWTKCAPKRYHKASDMISAERLDGVIIASPNCTHLDQLRAFNGLKVPILLEKPLDTSLEKICDIVRFAKSYKGHIVVHHVMRYAPIVCAARKIIDDDVLGEVCSAHFTQFIGGRMCHNFRRTMKGGGGQLIEKATHDFDVMLFLMGKTPIKVAALAKRNVYGGDKPDDLRCPLCSERTSCPENVSTGNPAELKDVNASDNLCVFAREIDVPDSEICLLEFEHDAIGVYSQCYFVNGYTTREYQLIGKKGYMRIIFSQVDQPADFQGRIIVRPRQGREGRIMELKFNYNGRIHYNGAPGVVRHFIDIMHDKVKPFTTVEQAFVAEMIGCAAYKSVADKQFVNIPDIVPPDLKDIFMGTYNLKQGAEKKNP